MFLETDEVGRESHVRQSPEDHQHVRARGAETREEGWTRDGGSSFREWWSPPPMLKADPAESGLLC